VDLGQIWWCSESRPRPCFPLADGSVSRLRGCIGAMTSWGMLDPTLEPAHARSGSDPPLRAGLVVSLLIYWELAIDGRSEADGAAHQPQPAMGGACLKLLCFKLVQLGSCYVIWSRQAQPNRLPGE